MTVTVDSEVQAMTVLTENIHKNNQDNDDNECENFLKTPSESYYEVV